MHVTTAFRNLDSHGRHRGPEVIGHEAALLEKRLARFRPDLVRLEATVSQTRGKKRIRADLRLGLPSGVIAAGGRGSRPNRFCARRSRLSGGGSTGTWRACNARRNGNSRRGAHVSAGFCRPHGTGPRRTGVRSISI